MARQETHEDRASIREAVEKMHSRQSGWLAAPIYDTIFVQIPHALLRHRSPEPAAATTSPATRGDLVPPSEGE